MLIALLVLAPAGARAAASGAVTGVSAPERVAQDGRLALTVKLRNGSRRAAKAGKLTVLLSADRKRDRRDLTVGTVRVPAVPARRTKTLRSTVTIAAKPGSYYLLVCARTCKVAMLRVEAKPAPGGGGAPAPQPAPGPQPSATPGATATPEATATPVATPTATPTSTATPGPTPDAPDETELPSGFGDSVEFLYSGPNKVQTGVAAGTIKAARVAVLRGSVHGRDGQGLGGVAVTVLDHPELGRTVTRADGGYDLAVNGGGPLTIEFARAGFVAAQREVVAPWQDFAAVEDVVLVAYDAKVTRIDLDAGAAQVAAGNPVTDGDGTRQASVVFKAGTKAEMVLPDGTVKPLDELDVRATEFTAGASGPDAMPGSLPPSSGYTYAAELSVDQAVAAGATEVRFDKPVINYVDNFLGFPVGGIVPDRLLRPRRRRVEGRPERPRDQAAGRRRRQGPDRHRRRRAGRRRPEHRRRRARPPRRDPPRRRRAVARPDGPLHAVGPQLALRARPRRRAAVAPGAARRRPGQPPPGRVQQGRLDHRLPEPVAGGGARRHGHAAEAALRHAPRGPPHRPLDRDPPDRAQDPAEPRAGPPRGLGRRAHRDARRSRPRPTSSTSTSGTAATPMAARSRAASR